MIRWHVGCGLVPIALAVVFLAPAGAGAQGVSVKTGDTDVNVVVDGDYVRVEQDGAVTEVSGDWRSGGRFQVAETEGILVDLGAVEEADHIRLNMQGDILFDFGSSAIRPDAALKLAQVAHVIRQRARGDVLIVGHTDSVGDEVANQKLSEARAGSVMSWFVQREGIPASIMVGRGMGEHQPIVHNTKPDGSDDPAGRARNRRVELFVATQEKADVRTIAGLVKIHGNSVEVPGVTVDSSGVTVGGIHVDTTGLNMGSAVVTTVGDATTCAAGKSCTADCVEGHCRMICPAGATCTYSCSGGHCTMDCSAGANCRYSCNGGHCTFSCAVGATCKTSCFGGHCKKS